MTRKFGRQYRVTIYPFDGGDPIIVELPFTIKFSMTRSINSSTNPLVLEIYNLNEESRNRIFQDWNDIAPAEDANGDPILNNEGRVRAFHNIIIEMGYDTLYKVYDGRMTYAGSTREGTNIITQIQAMDGMLSIAGTQTYRTLAEGSTARDLINSLIEDYNETGMKAGAVGSAEQIFTRPVALSGNTWELLKQNTDSKVYVDNGFVFVLKDDEVLTNVQIIDAASGLLETPRRAEAILEITTLLEPAVGVGEQIDLRNTIQKEYDGVYKVISITHSGGISAAVSEQTITRFGLQAPDKFKGFTVVERESGA
ncbi:hypothetical protein [uncultured Paraglaciecola sp.]|uniref:baseplate hub protein n=1 Tax=uncultured Paraglaciecola sp. TaxID=1765024 RepID=UPI0026279A75|nr:hypothetical protein [uncultured Paraglaciecola sp.]